jgi:hypothetical protein
MPTEEKNISFKLFAHPVKRSLIFILTCHAYLVVFQRMPSLLDEIIKLPV